MNSATRLLSRGLVLVLVCGSALSVATAQNDAQKDASNALSGPRVQDNGAPGAGARFAQGEARERGTGPVAERARAMAFVHAVMSLRSERTPEELRLSEDVANKVRQEVQAHRDAMSAFIEKHRAEIEGFAAQLPSRERTAIERMLEGPRDPAMGEGRPGGKEGRRERVQQWRERREGGRGMDGDAMMADDAAVDPGAAEAARAALRTLMEQAPKPVDAQNRIMALLTDAQKAEVERRMERFARERDHRGQHGRGPGGGEHRPRLTDAQRAELEALSPEQRREKLREWRDKGELSAPQRGKGAKGGRGAADND